jgi:hypothetical protein
MAKSHLKLVAPTEVKRTVAEVEGLIEAANPSPRSWSPSGMGSGPLSSAIFAGGAWQRGERGDRLDGNGKM